MSSNGKSFFAVPRTQTMDSLVVSNSRWWVFGVVFAKAWLVLDVVYLFYFLANTAAVVLGFVDPKTSIWAYSIKSIRILTFVVIHLIVILRLKRFKEMISKLITGQLSRWEEKGILTKRIKRCFYSLLFAFAFLFSLNLAEALFAFQVISFLNQLVDVMTFGNAHRLGKIKSEIVLLVDNLFYTALNSSMVALWLLCSLFCVTLNNEISMFKKRVESVSILTEALIRELHDSFYALQESIQSTDTLFSPLLFMWYFDALVSSLNGIVYFMENSLGDFTLVYAAFNFFVTSLAVLGLTFVASTIPINVEGVRSSLLDKARGSRFDYFHMDMFLFYKRLGIHRNALTAAGCFQINRRVCLSYIGFLVSYLIVLYSSSARNTSG